MESNWALIGHQWAINLLQNQIRSDRLRHAYLFLGPSGIGKRDLAIAFAKAMNCLEPVESGIFCDKCRVCRQINRSQHADFFILKREEGDKDIKVKALRELQRSLSLAPYDAEYRIALILNFQDASISASNALLKTLEEPPPKVILLLTAEIPESLLPTILSRCELIRLRPLALDSLSEELAIRGISDEHARLLAHVSGGRPSYAQQLHTESDLLDQRSLWLDDQQELISSDRRSRFEYAKKLSKDKSEFRQVLLTWSSFWRDVLLRSARADSPIENLDREQQIDVLADDFDLNAIHRFLADLQHTLSLLETNVNARLAAEVLLLDMPKS